MWRGMAALVCAIAFGYAMIVGVMYATQELQVYHPAARHYAAPSDIGLAYEDVDLEAEDGANLHAWFVPSEEERGVLLFLQGNAMNMSYRMESIEVFNDLGLSILIVDYRGFGKSEGDPDEEGTYRDAMAGWRYLTQQRGVSPDDIVIFGRSLGASVAAWLAARENPGAVILESGFTSAMDVAVNEFPWLPVRTLFKFEYDTLGAVRQIRAPVLVIHSEDDRTIPYEHSERLYEAIQAPKAKLILHGAHNEAFIRSNELYMQGLERFLSDYFR